MTEYSEYTKRTFQTRREAETWAKERKSELKGAELGVPKIDIDYDTEKGGTWTAKILFPV